MSNSIPSRSSPVDLQTLLIAFDASGQSAAAFARSNGLPPWKMYGALQRRSGKVRTRRNAARAGQPALLPVRVVETTPTNQLAAIELVLTGGHRVLLRPDFDALTLRRLLEALPPC
jgi:hypothetical protein